RERKRRKVPILGRNPIRNKRKKERRRKTGPDIPIPVVEKEWRWTRQSSARKDDATDAEKRDIEASNDERGKGKTP
ncbi:hypothetical protein SERLA73DRAFT_183872, partial [Serpula lacrymans var. lacrymans S7.3]